MIRSELANTGWSAVLLGGAWLIGCLCCAAGRDGNSDSKIIADSSRKHQCEHQTGSGVSLACEAGSEERLAGLVSELTAKSKLDAAMVLSLSPGTNELCLEASCCDSIPRGASLAPQEMLCLAYDSRSPLYRCLLSNEGEHFSRVELPEKLKPMFDSGTVSFASVPFYVAGSVAGVLVAAGRNSENVSAYSPDLFTELTDAVLAELCGTLARRSLALRAESTRIASDMMLCLGPEARLGDVTKGIVEAARASLLTDLVGMFMVDSWDGSTQSEGTRQISERVREAFVALYRKRLSEREPASSWVVRDADGELRNHRRARRTFLDAGICGFAACPVKANAGGSGALVAFYRTPIWRPCLIVPILEMLSGQAGRALSYAYALEQSRSLLDDLAGANHELAHQATVDGLTGLTNHREFQQTLADLCARHSERGMGPFCLAMVDVDHFKIYNDTYGHQEGDKVLQEVARVLQSGLRQGDSAARYGGEEFALIFRKAGKEAAFKAADRIRRAIADQSDSKGAVTVSIGVAEFPSDASDPGDLIEKADKALYHAKITGRNRVFAWGTPAFCGPENPECNGGTDAQMSVLVVESGNNGARRKIREALDSSTYLVTTASTVDAAIRLLKKNTYDIALVAIGVLPGGGIKSLGKLTAIHPHLPIVLVTPALPPDKNREALRMGACDVLLEPYEPNALPIVLERNLERRRLERKRVMERSTGLMLQAIEALVAAIDARDAHTAGHSERVTALSLAIADDLVISNEERYALELAAKLHDVGKLALPDTALNKESALNDEEWEAMRNHPVLGANIVGAIDELSYVSTIIRHHHERLDGSGYPDGLSGDAIPLASRIIGVADAYEAMTACRAHRQPMAPTEAMKELQKDAGALYDTQIVDMLRKHLQSRDEIKPDPDGEIAA